MKKTLFDHYTATAYTNNYIFGFTYLGKVYQLRTNSEKVLFDLIKLDKASRGAGYSLRFRPTIDQKQFMVSLGATVLCSVEIFGSMVNSDKYNSGEVFERIITEMAGQEWVKDSVPYTEAGDVEIKGVAYQIKFEGATFINEKQMLKAQGMKETKSEREQRIEELESRLFLYNMAEHLTWEEKEAERRLYNELRELKKKEENR